MPDECIEFTLKRPVFGLFDKSILDGIFPEIKPLLPVAFAVAQLAVKKIFLPDWLFVPDAASDGSRQHARIEPIVSTA